MRVCLEYHDKMRGRKQAAESKRSYMPPIRNFKVSYTDRKSKSPSYPEPFDPWLAPIKLDDEGFEEEVIH